MNIRFTHNFIVDVVQTYLNEQEEIKSRTVQHHITLGSIYEVSEYQIEGNSVRFVFGPTSPIQGTVLRAEKDYCEINDPIADRQKQAAQYAAAPRTGGCGGCGRK